MRYANALRMGIDEYKMNKALGIVGREVSEGLKKIIKLSPEQIDKKEYLKDLELEGF